MFERLDTVKHTWSWN